MAPRRLCVGALATSLVVLIQQVPAAAALRLESAYQHGALRAILARDSPERSRDSGATLFCFMVVKPGTSEVDTLKLHMREKMLSGCDAYTVYSNVSLAELVGGLSAEDLQLFTPHEVPAVQGSMDAAWEGWPKAKPITWSASNTGIFIQAWKHIWQAGLYQNYDWTLKVDPDTLLVPERMRILLQDRKEKVAVIYGSESERTQCPLDSGMGGVVAFTSGMVDAMEKYRAGNEEVEKIVTREDGLITAYCLHIDGCKKLDEPNFKKNGRLTADMCQNSWKAAFHEIKDPLYMKGCLDLVRNSTAHPDPSKLHTTCL